MGFTLFFSTRIHFLIFLLVLSSPCKFIQSPMDFGPLKLTGTTDTASLDFGRMSFRAPSAIFQPQSAQDISLLLSFIYTSSFSKLTVAAKGAGHSINGQAQALNGIVIEMDSLPSSIKIHKNEEKGSYVDVSGGTLWIELLEQTLKEGLAPRSWTDYLYLSVGGTLSNAGISGQTFKYGPQISNVLQLDVVTGTGELVTCSPSKSSELFYAALGGLGQFGIITKARIFLQESPKIVKWVRTFYDDFDQFIKDQKLLVVSMDSKVDYVEGFIVLNKDSLRSSFTAFPANLGTIVPQLYQNETSSKVYYCIEFAIYDQSHKGVKLDQVVEEISNEMKYLPTLLYSVEVSYLDFLNRVKVEEVNLRKVGMWDVTHPWLNMFVPFNGITQFKDLLLETISSSPFQGPILIYPIKRDKWNPNASAVLPLPLSESVGEDEKNLVYAVGMLRSANPNTCTKKCLNEFLQQNLQIATKATTGLGAKQYLPHYTDEDLWKQHFGGKWERFLARKSVFDPLHILAPGQSIFKRNQKKPASKQHY